MNTAEFKRKALGHRYQNEDAGGSGYSGVTGGYSGETRGGGPIGSEGGASYNQAGIGSGASVAGDSPTGGWSSGGGGGGGSSSGGGPIGSEAGANYNAPLNPETPKEAKSQGALMDAFTPREGGLAYRLGIRAPGTTAEQMFRSETAAEKTDRLGLINSGLEKAAKFVVGAMPGGGMLMALGNAAKQHEAGASWGDSLASAAKGILGGIVSSRINGEVGKALGPEGSAVLNGYNKLASVANLASSGTLPSINPGGAITQSLLGPSTTQPSQTLLQGGDTSPDGTQLPVGGWSSGGGSSSHSSNAPVEELPVKTATPAVTSIKANAYKKNGLYSAYF